MPAGYSGTPLATKLSLRDGQSVWWDNMPAAVRREIGEAGLALDLQTGPIAPLDVAHVFVTTRSALEAAITRLRPLLAPAGFLWVSWPKRASGVATDVTEDLIREIALPCGLVDVKVCAIDAVWSGLKLVVRRELR